MGLLTSIIQNHIEEKHRDEDQRKANLRQMYGKIAFDPDPSVSDDHREEARQNLSKLLNPEAKKSLQKAGPLFDHLLGVSRGLPTPDSSQSGAPQAGNDSTQNRLPTPGALPVQAGQTIGRWQADPRGSAYGVREVPESIQQPVESGGAPALQKAAISPMAANVLATPATKKPKGYFEVPSIGTNAERLAASRAVEDSEHNIWKQRAKEDLGPNADPRDLAEYAGSKGTKLPTKPQPGTRRAEQWKLPDGSTVDVDFDSKAGHRYDAKGEEWDVPEGATRVGKPVNLQLAWFKYPDDKEGDAPHAVRVDPRDPSKQLDASTNQPVPKGANQIDPALLAAKVRQNAYGQYGNLYRAALGQGYSDQEAAKIAGDRVEQEFNRRFSLMGAGSIHEALGEDAQGNPVAIQLHTTKVPNGVAPVAPPASQASPAAPQALPSAPGAASPSAVPATAPQAPVIPPAGLAKPAALPVASGSGIRPIEAFSPAQGRAFRDKLIPIRAGATQIFGGDPSHPDMKGIFQYSDLAENQQSKDRIGKVLRLTFDGLADATGHANVAVGAGPVSISTGGIGKFLENYFGVAPAVAEQQSKIMQDAISKLTPREQEYVNTVMSSFGTMVGLRSMTKASAAQGSIEKIERELPLIGINVTNKRSFADKHQKLAEEFFNGLQGLPPQAMKTAAPGLMERIQAVPKEMQDVKDQIDKKLPTPNGPKKEVSQAEVDAYAKKFNLSAADAKRHVEANGFTVK